MWGRIKRLFRAFAGLFIRMAEDPRLMLQQAIDDLREQIPEMNRRAAEVVKHEKLLDAKKKVAAGNIATIKKRLDQAIRGGESMHQAALTLMTTLKREESLFETIEIALDTAKKRSEEIKRIRELFERKIVDRIAHCKELISKSEIAAAERQVADVMGSFEVADVSDTIDRAEERISEDLAEAQARAEIASESGDARMAMVELATETDAAEIELEEYKRQMGFDVGTEGPSERTMPAIETLKTGEIVREDCVSETIK